MTVTTAGHKGDLFFLEDDNFEARLDAFINIYT